MLLECLVGLVISIVIYVVIPIIILAWMITFTYKDINEVYTDMERARQKRDEGIVAFFGTNSQSSYNNPSNITDDAFLLFIVEQKLAFGHPESAKSFGEEW